MSFLPSEVAKKENRSSFHVYTQEQLLRDLYIHIQCN